MHPAREGRRARFAALFVAAVLAGCGGASFDRTGPAPRADQVRPGLTEESPAMAASDPGAAALLRQGLAREARAATPEERDAAIAMIAAAAERGDAEAQYMVGAGDQLRPEPERDPARAARWLARAAAQGHARAQYALAQAYIEGTGVARDPAWA